LVDSYYASSSIYQGRGRVSIYAFASLLSPHWSRDIGRVNIATACRVLYAGVCLLAPQLGAIFASLHTAGQGAGRGIGGHNNVEHNHDTGVDSIGDNDALRGVDDFQAHAAVDDGHEDQDAAKDAVAVAGRAAGLVLDKVAVVNAAKSGLEDHEAADDGAEDGV